jgi:hypothetical protein
MKKLSGWQKAGIVAGVGCLSIVGVLAFGLVAAVIWARSTLAERGDTAATRNERTIDLAPAGAMPAGAATPAAPPTAGRLRLSLDLQEGSFDVRPGAPGEQLRVEGTWATTLYELTEDRQDTGGGAPAATIRFRSTAPAWAMGLAGLSGAESGSRPEVTVFIPRDLPIDLSLRVSMGESRIDLGGLTLGALDLDLSMGEHRVDFAQPLVDRLPRVRVNAHMGNVSLENLGNARAQAVDATGGMGNLTADFGGVWQAGAISEVDFDHSMGELTVRVPGTVRLEAVGNAQAEAGRRSADATQAEGPDAPVLRLRVSTSMGESRVVRY